MSHLYNVQCHCHIYLISGYRVVSYFQYFVGIPFDLITALHRLPMLSTSFFKYSSFISFHAVLGIQKSLSSFFGFLFLVLQFSSDHKFSIGFKSGD